MKILLASMLSLAILSSSERAESASVAIADLSCNSADRSLVLRYDAENDDGFSEPNLPKYCNLGKAKYKIQGQRGAFKQGGQCGAQPPISISVYRNGKPLIVDTVFGDNCFHGPAISSVEFSESNGLLYELKVCVLKSTESKPVCKTLPLKGHQAANSTPIVQSALDDLASRNER